MIKLPILDDDGYPIQTRGVTAYPGLFFVGLPWLHDAKSGPALAGMRPTSPIGSRPGRIRKRRRRLGNSPNAPERVPIRRSGSFCRVLPRRLPGSARPPLLPASRPSSNQTLSQNEAAPSPQ